MIEIQTRALYRLKPKLDKFLPFYPVTVVYPISYDKWVCWINEETGEITQKRKSPKKEILILPLKNSTQFAIFFRILIFMCVLF